MSEENVKRHAREVAEWDWVLTPTGLRLHHAERIDKPHRFNDESCSPGLTTCGLKRALSIPGVLSRMSMPRCARCSQLLGIPPGVGSPKNDDSIRPWVEARLLEIT